jgi:hypothetical protein
MPSTSRTRPLSLSATSLAPDDGTVRTRVVRIVLQPRASGRLGSRQMTVPLDEPEQRVERVNVRPLTSAKDWLVPAAVALLWLVRIETPLWMGSLVIRC